MRFLIICFLSVYFVSAQCPNDNAFYNNVTAPSEIGESVQIYFYPGEYSTMYLSEGNVYKISSCSDEEFDSQITIYNSAYPDVPLGYSDDYYGCGNNKQSKLYFSPLLSGNYHILLDEFPCDANQDNIMTVSVELISTPNPIITIPVVVHVLYNNSSQNIPNSQIYSQIETLNDDFRRYNDDILDTPVQFLGFSKDTRIEFCLATQDPNGNPSTGITRTQTDVSSFSAEAEEWRPKYYFSGGHDAWNTQEYLNIWVCNISGSTMGYATFPGGTEISSVIAEYPEEDGVVIDYNNFGSGGEAYDWSYGRTATHEVGHWLDLYHVFEDGCVGSGDFVNDTPFQYDETAGCPIEADNSCSWNDLFYSYSYGGDMYSNFMDYSSDECMSMFTYGQYLRMYYTLYGGYRDAIRYSNGCEISSNTSIPENFNVTRKLIKIIDVLGRETNNRGFQLHIYDDGSVEKKYLIK